MPVHLMFSLNVILFAKFVLILAKLKKSLKSEISNRMYRKNKHIYKTTWNQEVLKQENNNFKSFIIITI